MHENVVLVVNYDKICRFCLQSTGAMSDLFENNGETSLAKLVLCATGLKVNKGDSLPPNMCHKCRYIVELSCEFKDMCVKSHCLLEEASSNEHWTKELEKEPEVAPLRKDLQKNGILTYAKKDPGINSFEDPNDDLSVDEKLDEPFQMSTERVRKAAPKHLTCQICLTSFPTVDEVSTHVDTHYTGTELTNYLNLEKPYECEECRDGVISKTQLIKHHRRHLKVNPFTCNVCSFVGKNLESLRGHALTHGAYTQVCEQCGKRYRQRKDLRAHYLRAHRRQPNECQLCRRVFRNIFTYRAHLKYHQNEPRFACEWRGCPKAYHARGQLAAHMRAHSGERDYKCPLCDAAAYTSQSLLNRHLRLHQCKRISKCDKCLATFDDYGAFYRHRIQAHGPWQPYRCIGCNQGYQSEAQLHKHKLICEVAIGMQSLSEEANDEQMVVTCKEDTVATDQQALTIGTEAVPTLHTGRSLLVKPGNVHDLNKKGLVLHELPPDGLLYIEVDPNSDEENAEELQQ